MRSIAEVTLFVDIDSLLLVHFDPHRYSHRLFLTARIVTERLLCSLDVGIYASGISFPPSIGVN